MRNRRIDMRVMTKRIIMSISGVVLCGMSVGMFKRAAFGVDPFQALMSGLDAVIPIRFGTLYVIVNVLLLCFPLLVDRHKIGLATFINLFLIGYIAEFSLKTLENFFPDLGLIGRAVIKYSYGDLRLTGNVLFQYALQLLSQKVNPIE